MLKELEYCLQGLPTKYADLFQNKFSEVLKTSIKKQWVLTVWVARDAITPNHVSTQCQHPIL